MAYDLSSNTIHDSRFMTHDCYCDCDYELPINRRFTANDENWERAVREWRAVAVTGRGWVAGRPRWWRFFAAPGLGALGPRVPPIGLASLRPIGSTLGF